MLPVPIPTQSGTGIAYGVATINSWFMKHFNSYFMKCLVPVPVPVCIFSGIRIRLVKQWAIRRLPAPKTGGKRWAEGAENEHTHVDDLLEGDDLHPGLVALSLQGVDLVLNDHQALHQRASAKKNYYSKMKRSFPGPLRACKCSWDPGRATPAKMRGKPSYTAHKRLTWW
jgi:hypothetical protein